VCDRWWCARFDKCLATKVQWEKWKAFYTTAAREVLSIQKQRPKPNSLRAQELGEKRAGERAPGHVAHQNKNKLQLMLIGVGALSLLGLPFSIYLSLSLAELNSWWVAHSACRSEKSLKYAKNSSENKTYISKPLLNTLAGFNFLHLFFIFMRASEKCAQICFSYAVPLQKALKKRKNSSGLVHFRVPMQLFLSSASSFRFFRCFFCFFFFGLCIWLLFRKKIKCIWIFQSSSTLSILYLILWLSVGD